MLIANAVNITENAEREDGTADYDVWVGINARCIWRGTVTGHSRNQGAGALLRLIAAEIDRARSSAPHLGHHIGVVHPDIMPYTPVEKEPR